MNKIPVTKREAEILVFMLSRVMLSGVNLVPEIVGGLTHKTTSKHDIDIVLKKGVVPSVMLKQYLAYVLGCQGNIEDNNNGGYYFRDTFFGDVDIYFENKENGYYMDSLKNLK